MNSDNNNLDFIANWINQNETGKSSKIEKELVRLISTNRVGTKKDMVDEKKLLQELKDLKISKGDD